MSKKNKRKIVQSRLPTQKEQIYFKHLRDEMGFGSSVKLLPTTHRIRIPLKTGVVLSYIPSIVVLEESVAYHIAKDGEIWGEVHEYAKGELAAIGLDLLWVSNEEFPFEDY